jgi:hypothetical protein
MNKLANFFELKEDELAKVLYKTNAFLSGGSALNVFLDRDFEDGQDLDIFLRIPYSKENDYNLTYNYCPFNELALDVIQTYLKNNGYVIQKDSGEKQKRYWNSCKNKSTNEIEYIQSGLKFYIKGIKNFKKADKKIQIIILYNCSIEEFMNTFDLNICQLVIKGEKKYNNFTGYNFKLKFNNYHLSINDLNLIQDRKMYINISMYPYNLFDRILKYMNRGFELIDRKTGDVLFEDFSSEKLINFIYTKYNKILSYDNLIAPQKRQELLEILKDLKINENGDDVCKLITILSY